MSDFDKYIKQGEPEQAEERTLSNREMHVSVQSISPDVSKSQFDTLNCSLEESAVNLQKKGILVRKNGMRDGYWEILI